MIPNSDAAPSCTAEEDSSSSASHRNRRSRAREISRSLRKKTRKVLHVDDTQGIVRTRSDSGFNDVEGNPAFSPQRVFQKPVSIGDALRQTNDGLKSAAYTIIHPKDTAKRKAAAKLATPEQPFLSHQADKVLLDAHERLEAAQTNTDSEGEENARTCEEEVDNIQAQRESLRVAWTTSRFVHRVRVVPAQYIEHPRFEDFRVRDTDGNYVSTDWTRLWGDCCVYSTQDYQTLGDETLDQTAFSRHLLIEHLERVLMASAPWQSYFLRLRTIYRWEDPRKTGKWFFVFTILWISDYVLTFCLCYSVYIVLQNRCNHRSVRSLRESHERAMDQGATAYKISELIHRHGSGEWLDPLIDEIGPRAQLQLNDLADHLERLQNFYDWKFPEKTWATLFCILCAIILGVLTPTGYSMRVVTFVAIWWFFMGRPVASHYPRFRRTVSPVSYVFWDLPTHAQWSFRYLNSKAEEIRKRSIGRAVPEGDAGKETETRKAAGDGEDVFFDAPSYPIDGVPPMPREVYFLTFRCRYHGVPGRLAISSSGISFLRLFPAKELWSRHFHEISEMRKITGSAMGRGIGKIIEGKTLEFAFVDGATDQVEAVRKRDEAFNSIIGFSSVRWQVLEPIEGRNKEEVEGN